MKFFNDFRYFLCQTHLHIRNFLVNKINNHFIMYKQAIQILILLVLISCLNGLDSQNSCLNGSGNQKSCLKGSGSQKVTRVRVATQPPDGENELNVCIAANDPRGTGKIVYLSVHSDSGQYAKNLKLYSVGNCDANQKWNLMKQSNGLYCLQSAKFVTYYLSDDINSNPDVGYGFGRPVFRNYCQSSEYFNLERTESGGFNIRSNTGSPSWNLNYEGDLSTPTFKGPAWNWWVTLG